MQAIGITKEDAARITGLSLCSIKRALRRGELEAVRTLGRVFVLPSSIEPFMIKRRNRQEARKRKSRRGCEGQFKRFKQWQKLQN